MPVQHFDTLQASDISKSIEILGSKEAFAKKTDVKLFDQENKVDDELNKGFRYFTLNLDGYNFMFQPVSFSILRSDFKEKIDDLCLNSENRNKEIALVSNERIEELLIEKGKMLKNGLMMEIEKVLNSQKRTTVTFDAQLQSAVNSFEKLDRSLLHIGIDVEKIHESFYNFRENKRNNLIFYGICGESAKETKTELLRKIEHVLKIQFDMRRGICVLKASRMMNGKSNGRLPYCRLTPPNTCPSPAKNIPSRSVVHSFCSLGPKVQGCSPVLVTFESVAEREEVFRRTRTSLPVMRKSCITVTEDFSRRTRERRQQLHKHLREVKRRNPDTVCFIEEDRLIVGQKVFVWSEAADQVVELAENRDSTECDFHDWSKEPKDLSAIRKRLKSLELKVTEQQKVILSNRTLLQ